MTIEQILKLGEMGYTKEEIAQMEDGKEPEQGKEPETHKTQEDDKETKNEDIEKSAEALKSGISEYMNKLNETFENALKEIQAANLKNFTGKEDEKKTAEDVIVNVITGKE